LQLAAELDLPAIIHSRMAHEETIGILREFAGVKGKIRGVIHCFTGTAEEAGGYYDLGLYFGLNGIIFKLDLDQALVKMPLDRILLETDCPFLSPLPEIARNEPRFVKNVAERVAHIRNDSIDNVVEAATANAKKLFNL
jgi:TatD DNase family protein